MNTASAVAPPAQPRAPRLTRAQLKALKPHVITLTDGRLDREATPDPRSEADFATVEADIDAIFSTHLPKFIRSRRGAHVPIVLYAHGGLVDEEAGFATAERQVAWFKANGVYPIHFVWKTGAASAIWDAIGRFVAGGSRGFFDDAKDRVIEIGARALGGEQVWLDMKLDAAASSDGNGGARIFARKLAEWMNTAGPGDQGVNGDRVSIHAVGHSAGSIFHSHLIPAALEEDVPGFQTVTFLAPAVRIDTFKKKLLPVADRIGNLTVFTMTDAAERDDNCFRIYGKSLLYLVSASFEPVRGTPILGLAKDIEDDAEVMGFLAGPRGELVLTPNRKPRPQASTARSHGGFDDDAPTMESTLLRIAPNADVSKHPFPSSSRSIDLWPQLDDADGPRSTANLRALCIGIDAYPREGDRLQGAVADSRLWASVLEEAGFAVTSITDRDATRQMILGSIYQLVTNASEGDVLVVQYSGHGTHAPDLDGDEDDRQDEAICPVDFRSGDLILDDDLALLWDLIPDGVSVTIFFDSCHSGGSNRDVSDDVVSLGRSVELTAGEVAKFRIARGADAPNGRKTALSLVRESESAPEVPEPSAPTSPLEVQFAACLPTQLAWETAGQGDFTKYVAPLIAAHIGRVSNARFAEIITEGFDSRRQDPLFTGDAARSELPLLASAFAGDVAAVAPDAAASGVPGSSAIPSGSRSRDAAIAQILRGVADLVEA